MQAISIASALLFLICSGLFYLFITPIILPILLNSDSIKWFYLIFC